MSYRYILDARGQPKVEPDLFAWARWFETADRTLAVEEPIPGVRVSTVFLGIDHSFGFLSAPVLWETMIFGGPHDEYQERYTSRADAEAGHRRAVERVIEGEATT